MVTVAVVPGAGHLAVDSSAPGPPEGPPYLLARPVVGNEQGPVDLTQAGIVGRNEDAPPSGQATHGHGDWFRGRGRAAYGPRAGRERI